MAQLAIQSTCGNKLEYSTCPLWVKVVMRHNLSYYIIYIALIQLHSGQTTQTSIW